MRVTQAFRFELERECAPWWVEVSKCAPQEALRDIERAVRNWQQGRARRPRFPVVEDLGVRGLGRGRLSRSVADAGWGEFRWMLEYKARWYGSRLTVAPRGFPSTRRCARCEREDLG